ncbi:molecular chaperone DnaJ [Nakamurella antarctica]|uniref:Chaperone protein DnaJ n=1 Tax=Nakamurella antarctica TaxID=1902245 RepID=A0A3G8ZWM6_9ACTN|nr:molecular chaperone DnaJ [Nakamurella antarctica]AZI58416.1 molecular chaperone DnaJ [Nakamurella antarctica]
MARDYYGLLGVRKDASADEIKRAYRKLARELHPDVNPDPEAQQRFKEVSSAYEVLSDPAKRQVVDLGGDPLGSGGNSSGQGQDPFGNMGFGDIMDAFFGGGGGRQRGPRSRVRQGDDALIPIELTLEECATGVAKDLAVETATICSMCQGAGTAEGTTVQVCDTCKGAGEIQQIQRSLLGQVVTARPCPVCKGFGEVIPDPCRQCNGDGRVRTRRSVRVNIPAGVGEGIRVRMSGQGEVGPGGGAPGDLYVEVREKPHDMFTRDGVDLHCTVHVPMTAAALGTSMTLTTLLDTEELDIKAGTQSGTVLTIRSKGMPRLRGTGSGNLFVHIEVITPTKVEGRQAELLRELASLRGEEQAELAERSQGSIFSRIRDSLVGR